MHRKAHFAHTIQSAVTWCEARGTEEDYLFGAVVPLVSDTILEAELENADNKISFGGHIGESCTWQIYKLWEMGYFSMREQYWIGRFVQRQRLRKRGSWLTRYDNASYAPLNPSLRTVRCTPLICPSACFQDHFRQHKRQNPLPRPSIELEYEHYRNYENLW